ncbi:MAG: hypothetical protein Q7J14_01370 [Candidatus Magasanikbacteria bacterium]|nr:hypothetical protein [Candidatus Magasanikbacteria bacterium]
MFGKKEENLLPEKDIFVETIPEDFYGGKNPVVVFKNVTETVDLKKNQRAFVTAEEKKKFHEATTAGAGESKWHLANLATNPKALAVLAGILFVIISLGAGSYYYIKNNFFNKPGVDVTINIPPIVPLTPTIPEIPVVIEEPEIPVKPTSTEPEIPKEIPLEFPSILLAESVDSDNDGLTDLAEEEFKTDPGDFDTDKDEYPDGREIFYLYNPKGIEPQRLIESNLVKEYISPNFSYQLYLPVNWAIGSVDEEGRQLLFSTLSGENIEIRVFDLAQDEDFNSWFARFAINQDINSLNDFETYDKYSGKMRNDGLVYYFVYNNKVYAVLYHTTDSNFVNYKAIISLVARSLKFGYSFEVVVPQELLDVIPTSTQTTTGSIENTTGSTDTTTGSVFSADLFNSTTSIEIE